MNRNHLFFVALLAVVTGCSILGKAENDYIGDAGGRDTNAPDGDVGDTNADAPDTVACGDCADPTKPFCRVADGMAECVACLGDTDCPSNNCDETVGTCGDCVVGECPSGLSCDESDGMCVECYGGASAVACTTPGDFCVDRACTTCAPSCEGDTICAMGAGDVTCAPCDDDGDGFPREECGAIDSSPTRDSVPVDCNDSVPTENRGLICGSCGAPTPIFDSRVERHGIAERVAVAETTELKVVIVNDEVHVIYVEDASGDSTPDTIQDVVATLGTTGSFTIADAVEINGGTPTTAVSAMDAVSAADQLHVGFIDAGEFVVPSPIRRSTIELGGGTISMFPLGGDVLALGQRIGAANRFNWFNASSGALEGDFMFASVLQFDAAGDSVAFRLNARIEIGHHNSDAAPQVLATRSTHIALVATSGDRRVLLYEDDGELSSVEYRCTVGGCGFFTQRTLIAGDLIEGAHHDGVFPIISREAANIVTLRFLDQVGAPATRDDAFPVAELFNGRFTMINDIAVDVAPVTGGTLVVTVASGEATGGGHEVWMMSYLLCPDS